MDEKELQEEVKTVFQRVSKETEKGVQKPKKIKRVQDKDRISLQTWLDWWEPAAIVMSLYC